MPTLEQLEQSLNKLHGIVSRLTRVVKTQQTEIKLLEQSNKNLYDTVVKDRGIQIDEVD